MLVLNVRNAQQALPEGLRLLDVHGVPRESRNGPVLVAPGPVTTVFEEPRERVMFWPERDANPFFHLVESLWMLAGRNDVDFLAEYVSRMRTFSDDGKTLHGAYGHRWRRHFGKDQLRPIIEALKANPEDRRNVLQMWDATVDLARQGKDLPCNTQVFFSRDADGNLDMTVLNRSNDVIWGAYGANVVHFSVLQEYMAGAIGCGVGRYWQVSNNYHAYLDTLEPIRHLADQAADPHRTVVPDPYETGGVTPLPLVSTPIEQWDQDLEMLLSTDEPVIGLRDPFLRGVATPMMMAHRAYRENLGLERYEKALEILERCRADDWRLAAQQWINRRLAKFERSSDDGVDYN